MTTKHIGSSKIKAYSYVRMSTSDQRQGDSLRRQLERTTLFVEQHNLELVEKFEDQGVSGFKGLNSTEGALARFIRSAKNGQIPKGSYLIIESLDRLTRTELGTALKLFLEIVDLSIVIVTLDNGQQYTSQRLRENQLELLPPLLNMARSHEESKRKADLLGAVWGEKKRRAKTDKRPITSMLPGWLTLSEDKQSIISIPERVAVVNEIFKRVIDGEGMFSIARDFNRRGEKTWGTKSKSLWGETYIKKIATNRALLGEYQPYRYEYDGGSKRLRVKDGNVIEGYYPILIDELKFVQAHRALASRRIGATGRKSTNLGNLFSGLLKCDCGHTIRYIYKGPKPKGGNYLMCSSYILGGSCHARYSYEAAEEQILNAITEIDVTRSMNVDSSSSRLTKIQIEIEHIDNQLLVTDSKIERLMQLVLNESILGELSIISNQLKILKHEADRLSNIRLKLLHEQELIQSTAKDDRKQAIVKFQQIMLETDVLESQIIIRKKLSSDIRSLVESITVTRTTKIADDDWHDSIEQGIKQTMTFDQYKKLLKQYPFELIVCYRDGSESYYDPMVQLPLRFQSSLTHPQLSEFYFQKNSSKKQI